jgi:hypothetical protein
VISSVYCRTGESIEAGEPVVAISPLAELPEPTPADPPETRKAVVAEVH